MEYVFQRKSHFDRANDTHRGLGHANATRVASGEKDLDGLGPGMINILTPVKIGKRL